MASKKWGYLIDVFTMNPDTGFYTNAGEFEAEGMSPYKFIGASPYADIMKSEDYDQVASPQAVGDFVRWIGDHNTLTVKKLHDPTSDFLWWMFRNDALFGAIQLYVAPLTHIPGNLKTEARNSALRYNSTEEVAMKTVKVSNMQNVTKADPNGSGGRMIRTYEFVTFEVKEYLKFFFKGKDW